jgi:hypothetical protein
VIFALPIEIRQGFRFSQVGSGGRDRRETDPLEFRG